MQLQGPKALLDRAEEMRLKVSGRTESFLTVSGGRRLRSRSKCHSVLTVRRALTWRSLLGKKDRVVLRPGSNTVWSLCPLQGMAAMNLGADIRGSGLSTLAWVIVFVFTFKDVYSIIVWRQNTGNKVNGHQ